jgi:hypothetical protein
MRCTTDVLIRINPVFYAFEILVANEFHGVNFPCDQYIPAGPGYGLTGTSFICNSVGSVAGQTFVSGDRYLDVAYEYSFSHVCKSPPPPSPGVFEYVQRTDNCYRAKRKSGISRNFWDTY